MAPTSKRGYAGSERQTAAVAIVALGMISMSAIRSCRPRGRRRAACRGFGTAHTATDSRVADHAADQAHKGKVTVAVKHLGSGESFAYHENEVMPTASLIKFPVMIEAYRQAAAKKVDLNAVSS